MANREESPSIAVGPGAGRWGMGGVRAQDKVFVWSIGVDTDSCGDEPAISLWNKLLQEPANGGNIGVVHLPTHVLEGPDLAAVVQGDFDPISEIGEAIEKTTRGILEKVDGKRFGSKQVWTGLWLEPAEHLALDGQRERQAGEKRARPRPGRNNQAVREITIRAG